MAYYWRRPRWRRYRRTWRRRFRTPFRRRLYRRRRRWRVRKKLKKIHISEWQPTKINRLKIVGLYPLYEGTKDRTGNNNTQYIDSTAPHYIPGGGLFSITKFTLAALYEMHTKARNWWTKSNCTLPLIKYLGCNVTFYRSENSDYVSVYARCGSLTVTEQMYQSCQPSILNLNKNKVTVTCLKNTKSRKPYKKIFIPPPTLMTNKWYFQQEIANTPLFLLLTSAMSLNRYYISSTSISSTIGFYSLNTDVYKFHNWKEFPATQGYRPNSDYMIMALATHTDFATAKFNNLIYLGNTNDYQEGTPLQHIQGNNIQQRVDNWLSDKKYWGNIFKPTHFSDEGPLLVVTNLTFDQFKAAAKNNNGDDLIKNQHFTEKSTPNYWECRYNPQNDRGHNTVYLTKITNDPNPWGPPQDIKLKTEGLPLWVLLFGYTDWLTKSNAAQRMYTDYCMVIISDYITPKKPYYVILDPDFIIGKSPFQPEPGAITIYDRQNWHPKLNFQEQAITTIINSGPGTVKLPPNISTEAHIKYSFKFKLGGCPAPMDDVCNPQTQPTFPRPGNILSTTLLQNPETPMQYYLSSFDQRRGLLTEKAAKRLKTHTTFKETMLEPTGTTQFEADIQTPETTSTSESEEEEKEPETLQLNIQRQRRKQRKLQLRIKQLLKQIQKLS
nr:MAG: ORF1 [TTV-like mini virus]